MTRVCVIGSVNLDQSFAVRALPRPGETVLASSTSYAPGGKGGNQAIAAARAGASVQLVAAFGQDAAADRLRTHLRDNGVCMGGAVTVSGPTGAAIIVVDSAGENTIVVAPGANAHLSMADPASRAAVAAADVVLMQLEIPVETALVAARMAREAGAVVMINASPTPAADDTLAELARAADVVIVNEDEAVEWPWPVPHLVTTRGAAGASHREAGIRLDVPAPSVQAVDTTGAGDVFAGVVAAQWFCGPEVALRRGCAAGALATLTAGAGDCAPHAEAIDEILQSD